MVTSVGSDHPVGGELNRYPKAVGVRQLSIFDRVLIVGICSRVLRAFMVLHHCVNIAINPVHIVHTVDYIDSIHSTHAVHSH